MAIGNIQSEFSKLLSAVRKPEQGGELMPTLAYMSLSL